MSYSYDNLLIHPVGAINHYLQKRYNNLPLVKKMGLDHIKLKGDFILSHAWKLGYITLTKEQAESFKNFKKNGREEINDLLTLPKEWIDTEGMEPDVDGLIEKVIVPGLFEMISNEKQALDTRSSKYIRLRNTLESLPDIVPVFPAIQNTYELKHFLEGVKKQKPKTVVEIGTASGGLFYCLSQLADPEALMVSIDYPGGPYGGGQDESEIQLYSSFGRANQEFAFIRDRSFHHSTKIDLKKILGDRKIDLLFIDGDHSYGGVHSDFNMYKEFVGEGGVIAFHDISSRPESWGRGYDAGVFWNEIKHDYENVEEIIDPNGCKIPFLLKEEDFLAYGIGKITI
ncbi:class I SAM-dependent methyltransferase [Bacillus cereus]|uniref:class I SAM-dependent methyltransferase n=1 Tax=Bacillus cereus TaxID=1396 RepID=UPI00124429D8|nr:class I SAM-dependent methyltransferase [Bacillus cereus]MCU5475463.1 class I SAM-dependent methyltransferase [Bacillus cereus]MCU5614898.1 class I SAM-dependent methyltransferase [Bacillus cereus]